MCGNLSLFLSDYLPQLACLLFFTCRSVNKFHKVSHLELQRCKLHRRCHKFQYSRKRHQLNVALMIYNAILSMHWTQGNFQGHFKHNFWGTSPSVQMLIHAGGLSGLRRWWGASVTSSQPLASNPTAFILNISTKDIWFSRHAILNISVQQKSPTDLQSNRFFWNR